MSRFTPRKQFKLHFRWRTHSNQLNDLTEFVEAFSLKEAKQIGKDIEAERSQSYGGKFWFMGVLL